jgi:hypothetical protein
MGEDGLATRFQLLREPVCHKPPLIDCLGHSASCACARLVNCGMLITAFTTGSGCSNGLRVEIFDSCLVKPTCLQEPHHQHGLISKHFPLNKRTQLTLFLGIDHRDSIEDSPPFLGLTTANVSACRGNVLLLGLRTPVIHPHELKAHRRFRIPQLEASGGDSALRAAGHGHYDQNSEPPEAALNRVIQ